MLRRDLSSHRGSSQRLGLEGTAGPGVRDGDEGLAGLACICLFLNLNVFIRSIAGGRQMSEVTHSKAGKIQRAQQARSPASLDILRARALSWTQLASKAALGDGATS